MKREPTLCYVRVRCPCCGMWTRMDNLKHDQPLCEESACYSRGDKGLFHKKKVNESLRSFWIAKLRLVLQQLGYGEKPYEFENPIAYAYNIDRGINYGTEKGVSYGYER